MMYVAFRSVTPSFTTVTMVTWSKAMYNATPAPSVNYGYTNTIGYTFISATTTISHHVIPSFSQKIHLNAHKWGFITPGTLNKPVRSLSKGLHWDSFHMTFIFTQLIDRHLQLVQTGNVSRRMAETWHQIKPGDPQCMHVADIRLKTKTHRIQCRNNVCMSFEKHAVAFPCSCNNKNIIITWQFTVTTAASLNVQEARGFI